MAIHFMCDGCSEPVENPERVGHILKRDYCSACAAVAKEFIEAEEKLRAATQSKFVDDRAALIVQYSADGFLLPDVPDQVTGFAYG